MSTNQSDRAQGRVRELRERVLDRLEAHAPLTDRLNQALGDEHTAADVIVPRLTLQRWRDDDQAPDPPTVTLAVGTISTSSNRRNHKEDVRLAVQVELDVHPDALRRQGPAWADEVLDECSAVLTAHDPGWNAQGESGGTLEPRWDDDNGRYVAMRRYTIRSFV